MRTGAGRIGRAVAVGRSGLPLGTGAAALLLLLFLVPPTAGASVAPGAALRASSATLGPATPSCNSVYTPTPSAVLIPTANPSHPLVTGGELTVYYEVAALNFTSALNGTKVYVPNVWFRFPIVGGPLYEIHENATVLTLTNGNWTSPALTEKNVTVAGGLAFNQSQKATLDSQKLAVMATATYGNLTIEMRWRWQNTVTGGGRPAGSWSTPTRASGWPKALPSIFEPAPYVYITNFNPTAVIGSNYSANLAGLVAGAKFFLEMEYPTSGKVVQDLGQTAPRNATNFTVQIPVLNYDNYLSPGTFLIHIHDGCGAMLWNKIVDAVYPAWGNVTFYFQPGSCGPITFNGSTYANGTTASVRPSTTPYNFSLPACKGYSFKNWVTTGGLHIESSKQLLVSARGTFTVEYS